jgi:hypothetical protein
MKLLEATRKALGPPPRRQPLSKRPPDRGVAAWLGDAGDLVLGWTVVAGEIALVVHPPANAPDVNLVELIDVAGDLERCTGAKNPSLARVGKVLADRARVRCLALPPSVTRGRTLVLSTIRLDRAVLPLAYVGPQIVPLLVHPATPACAPLACDHWAADLRAAWFDLVVEP